MLLMVGKFTCNSRELNFFFSLFNYNEWNENQTQPNQPRSRHDMCIVRVAD
eukprot:m.243189 g.243189  ORF g.243189 m.243189 type:complete len:51 (-) comp26601_c1_seq11:2780-2932(-)